MRDADTAMYHAKSRGKARHELFDADMHARVLDRLGLENDLRRAIDQHDLVVHYQPIVSLASRRCVGFESLVRWTRNGKPVPPSTFIPIAEEIGLIEPLGTWVLQQACAAFADWQRRFPRSGLEYITVNVSGRQLMQQNLLLVVEEAVRSAGMRPCDLRLEITETALMDSPGDAARVLGELREFGVKIYLDDFGTGFSSLSHLHKLPVDALKIDRSFVTSLLQSDRPAIVESILALARTLQDRRGGGRHRRRRAGERARAAGLYARAGLPVLAPAAGRRGRGSAGSQSAARARRSNVPNSRCTRPARFGSSPRRRVPMRPGDARPPGPMPAPSVEAPPGSCRPPRPTRGCSADRRDRL